MIRISTIVICLLSVSLSKYVLADETLDEISEKLRRDDYLVMPEGEGPFPVAIILHTTEGPREMDRAWARTLAANGIAGLVVKSYRRFTGDDPVLSRYFRRLRAATPERVQDIAVTIEYLRLRAGLILCGSSCSDARAWAALWFLATEMTAEDNRGVIAVVAYYPDCDTGQPYTGGWSATVPVLIQMGRDDRLTQRQPCIGIAEAEQAKGHPVAYAVYKGKGHNVDQGTDDNAAQARLDTLRFLVGAVTATR